MQIFFKLFKTILFGILINTKDLSEGDLRLSWREGYRCGCYKNDV